MIWPFFTARDAERIAEKAAKDFLSSDRMLDLIDTAILKAIRETPNDRRLTFVGFINKMAITIYDAAGQQITYDEAKRWSMGVWMDFKRDNGVLFGADGWDWDGAAARLLAHEYSIQYWD